MAEKEKIKSLVENLEFIFNTLYLERDETHNILKNNEINKINDQLELYKNYLNDCLNIQRRIRQLKLTVNTPSIKSIRHDVYGEGRKGAKIEIRRICKTN